MRAEPLRPGKRMKEYQHQPDNRTAAIRRRRDLVRQSDAMRKVQAKKEAATIQPKLEISAPGDKHEQEADAVAKAVVSGSDAQLNLQQSQNDSRMHAMRAAGYGDEEIAAYTESEQEEQTTATPHVQKKEEEEEKGALMAKGEDGGLKGTTELQAKLDASKGSGQALDDKTRSEMEGHMGADLGDVKIHTGSNAHEMADGINARAFTHGQDIYFKNGNYNTDSPEGKELLAHELTHTQQQKQGVERKVQRQIDLDIARLALKAFVAVQPTTLIINALLDRWQSIPEKEREKMVNDVLDKKIAGLKLLEDKDPPGPLKVASKIMSGLTLMPMPSLETMWPIIVSGEVGYYEYLRNLSNKYVKPEQVVGEQGKKAAAPPDPSKKSDVPPPGMAHNPNYKKGGYAKVIENQLKNMVDPDFMLGEIEGVFSGIGGWFLSIGQMFSALWDMMVNSFKDIKQKISDLYTLGTTGTIPKDMLNQMRAAEAGAKWLKEHKDEMMGFIRDLITDEKKREELAAGFKSSIAIIAKTIGRSAGAGIAKVQADAMSLSAYEQGEKVGYAVGFIIPEILLAVFSGTIGTWIKNGLNAFRLSQAGIATLRAARWLAELGKGVFTALGKFGEKLKAVAGTAYKGISDAFEAVMAFFKRLMGLEKEFPDEALGKTDEVVETAKGKGHETPAETRKNKPKDESEVGKENKEQEKTLNEEKKKTEEETKKEETKEDNLDVEKNTGSLDKIDQYVEDGAKKEITQSIENGTIDQNIVDDVADEVVESATKKKRKLTWEEVKALFKRGNDFNAKGREMYEFNEVTLENGKRLDSYIEGKEIISRKATTLNDIKFSTFEGYLKELVTKYTKGKRINAPKFGNKFKNKVLSGEYFLEIPSVNKNFPRIKEYEEFAKKQYNITIKYLDE